VAIGLIVMNVYLISDNNQTQHQLHELKNGIDVWKNGCDAQEIAIQEKIDALNVEPINDICVNGICSRYPSIASPLNFLGCWDADTNDPLLLNNTGTPNDAYIVCVNGTTTLDGQSDWDVGDLLIFLGGSENAWIKNDGSPENLPDFITDIKRTTIPFKWICGGNPVNVNASVEFFELTESGIQVYVPEIFIEDTMENFELCFINTTESLTNLELLPILNDVKRVHVTKARGNGFNKGSIELQTSGNFQIFLRLNDVPFQAIDSIGDRFFGSKGYEFIYLK